MSHAALILLPQQPTNTPTAPSSTQTGGAAPGAPAAGSGTAGTQQPGSTQSQQPELCSGPTMWMFPLFLAVMWLLVIRPESRRRKEMQAMMGALKAGDRVVTTGGMHGVVTEVAERTVTLRCDQNRFVFDRTAIARVERDDAQKQAPTKP